MINGVDLVIFDCDGVLVDSERIAVRVNVDITAQLGWPLTAAEVIDRFIGRSHASIAEIIAAELGAEAAATWTDRFETELRQAVDAELTAVDGIEEALGRITAPTCVASSGTPEKLRHTLGRTGLYPHFAGRIFSATEVPRGKPAPDLFLHAAARMGVSPQGCVVVEDSQYGVQAARAAGMRCLAYAGGLTAADRLQGPGTIVFDDMRDLPALLDKI
ncbi:putative haloacid dehalogenase-like hydrolase [Actinoplanes missouriensis 431]|uniref:Putative haloacid dehalogenase-like hydrolase n=1 Tax=Actinoplanes missouriensis (strain ATCC 14538 / DSM 43046 / CBS 188.64 / JCM 3121 / NBRC 102363 / NCIMB 12654 / NRRL B-3342 / UNCC 431) TaxID=512565 RepID=I0H430_ACTM4|nr:HAD family hydrolase [Actinoplanes missouriensis]BAL87767.1 putative haloacid dehalogenase-like hydrolase [Actinoplanes missouriensis 431]